jgi:hypothetical protein
MAPTSRLYGLRTLYIFCMILFFLSLSIVSALPKPIQWTSGKMCFSLLDLDTSLISMLPLCSFRV